MRLDFNTLWVEDQPNAVKDQSLAISDGMKEQGFEFRPTMCRSLAEVKTLVSDDVFNDQVDLVLVDWDLGAGPQGQQAITEIRAQGIRYKDVIFYSANSNVPQLRQIAHAEGVEGVYYATRAQLVMEVLGVFELLVKKVLDLDHSRGIVMGATSDIDQMVLEIVAAVLGNASEEERMAVVSEAIGIIENRIEEHFEGLEKLRADGSMTALLKAHMLFTANDRLRMLHRVLGKESFQEHAASREFVTRYIQEVVPKRNDLGHKVLLPDGRTMAIASIDGAKEMSLEELRDLRCSILGLRVEFRDLRDTVSR